MQNSWEKKIIKNYSNKYKKYQTFIKKHLNLRIITLILLKVIVMMTHTKIFKIQSINLIFITKIIIINVFQNHNK